MTRCVLLLLFCATGLSAQQSGTIQTVAGNGAATFSGDGGAATQSALNVPVDVAVDRAGNIFIADQFNHRIRRVAANGTISTVAGNGSAGYSGDGGPATDAQINTPTGVFVDDGGTLFIADVGNQRIRRVDLSGRGIITTVAGNGAKGYNGDGINPTTASFYNPVRVAVDSSGNILIADQSNHRIRRIQPGGFITTIAGDGAGTPSRGGFSGDGGQATAASLNNPTALAVSGSGVIYFSDQVNQRIRRIAIDGTITTIAGNGSAGFSGDGGPATSASLNYPGGLALDVAGNLYVNDDLNFRTRRIAIDGTISTIAGNGSASFSGDGGPATAASLNGNFGITVDLLGSVVIADSVNNRIRSITKAVPGFAPVITSAGFTNAASFATGASPGALATIFGTHLTRNLGGIVQNSTVPLPSSLAGTSVTIGDKTAPVFQVVNLAGQEQISVQVPFDVPPGSAVPVVLNNGFGTVTVPIDIAIAQPGVFASGQQTAALHANFTLVSSAQPAVPGETVIVFSTGLGAVTPAGITGAAASSSVLSFTQTTFTATVGGQNAPVSFSGLAPGFVALYQVNLVIPAGVSGPQDLVLTGAGASSNVTKIQIR